ncbi:MAG: sugar transferase [Pseudomonadota bacterium]
MSTEVGNLAEFEETSPGHQVSFHFRLAKRMFDIFISLLLLPLFFAVAVVLLILNPMFNKGGLFFVQKRMGRGTLPFDAYKFRSMIDRPEVERGANDPIETDRITRLGHYLRKSRIDELPQIINVLNGDMSLIGPRPDYYAHAEEYLTHIPGYRARHAVRPGISGYAQTEVGYVDNMDAVAAKVAADLYYIRNRRLKLEAWIFWRTLVTVVGHKGS